METDETTYTPSGDENQALLAKSLTTKMKQPTPRQGTKTTETRSLQYHAYETTYTPSGDENSLVTFIAMIYPETTYTPSGDENFNSKWV